MALNTLFDRYLQTGSTTEIKTYLAANSNLPGPRGNLELAYAFADTAKIYSSQNASPVWQLALQLTEVSAEEAPTNTPEEFLPFCGIVAVGAVASLHPSMRADAFARLKKMAGDSRWRTREGVAMGIQKLVPKMGQAAFKELERWVAGEDWLAMRAVAAGVAEPALLKDAHTAQVVLELHQKIFTLLMAAKARKTSEFKALRQALGYSLSVVICAVPAEGFAYLQKLIVLGDGDVLWVVKENLKKNRLVKNFPLEVAAAKRRLL